MITKGDDKSIVDRLTSKERQSARLVWDSRRAAWGREEDLRSEFGSHDHHSGVFIGSRTDTRDV